MYYRIGADTGKYWKLINIPRSFNVPHECGGFKPDRPLADQEAINIMTTFFLSILFILSSGLLFSDRFRNKMHLVILASLLSFLSAYYVFHATYNDLHGWLYTESGLNTERSDTPTLDIIKN